MFCSKLSDLVYACMLCASHSNSRVITWIRTHVFSKTKNHVSKGRSFDRVSGGAHCMTFPSRTQVPEPRQLWGWWRRGLRHKSGFPKFLQNKIFRWRLCIWQSSPCLALLSKICFLKTICRIWTLWFRLRPVTNLRVLSCSDPKMNGTGARSSQSVRGRLQFLASLLGI